MEKSKLHNNNKNCVTILRKSTIIALPMWQVCHFLPSLRLLTLAILNSEAFWATNHLPYKTRMLFISRSHWRVHGWDFDLQQCIEDYQLKRNRVIVCRKIWLMIRELEGVAVRYARRGARAGDREAQWGFIEKQSGGAHWRTAANWWHYIIIIIIIECSLGIDFVC